MNYTCWSKPLFICRYFDNDVSYGISTGNGGFQKRVGRTNNKNTMYYSFVVF